MPLPKSRREIDDEEFNKLINALQQVSIIDKIVNN